MRTQATRAMVRPLFGELDRVGSRVLEDRIQMRPPGSLPMLHLTGSPTTPLPDHARAALLAALDEPGSRPSGGLPELLTAIARSLSTETGVEVNPADRLLATNGAMQAISIVCRTLLSHGDQVLIPAPNFFLEGIVRLAGGVPVYVPSQEAEGWRWDLERIEAAMTTRVRIIFACNPTNPTGYLPTERDLNTLLDLAERHDAVVLSDESYGSFVYEGARLHSILREERHCNHWVLVRSLSKSHALATWRVGYILATPQVIDACTTVLEWEVLHCGYVAQRVATAVLDGPMDWLGDVLMEFQQNRDEVYRCVAAASWCSCHKPQAGPFLFLDVRPRNERAIADQLLDLGVPTVEGRYFGTPGYLRLPFGGDGPTIDRLCDVLSGFVPAAIR